MKQTRAFYRNAQPEYTLADFEALGEPTDILRECRRVELERMIRHLKTIKWAQRQKAKGKTVHFCQTCRRMAVTGEHQCGTVFLPGGVVDEKGRMPMMVQHSGQSVRVAPQRQLPDNMAEEKYKKYQDQVAQTQVAAGILKHMNEQQYLSQPDTVMQPAVPVDPKAAATHKLDDQVMQTLERNQPSPPPQQPFSPVGGSGANHA